MSLPISCLLSVTISRYKWNEMIPPIPSSATDKIEKTLPNLNGMMEGKTAFNQASTIVNCKSKEIKIERLGPISMKQIIAALNK